MNDYGFRAHSMNNCREAVLDVRHLSTADAVDRHVHVIVALLGLLEGFLDVSDDRATDDECVGAGCGLIMVHIVLDMLLCTDGFQDFSESVFSQPIFSDAPFGVIFHVVVKAPMAGVTESFVECRALSRFQTADMFHDLIFLYSPADRGFWHCAGCEGFNFTSEAYIFALSSFSVFVVVDQFFVLEPVFSRR